MSDDRELLFWQCGPGLADVAAEVEGEVYDAIRDLLADPPSPDFLLDGIWPSPCGIDEPAEGWGVFLLVEGQGRPDIRRFVNAAELVREELDNDRTRDGSLYLTEEEEQRYRLLAERLRASADEIDEALRVTKRPEQESPS